MRVLVTINLAQILQRPALGVFERFFSGKLSRGNACKELHLSKRDFDATLPGNLHDGRVRRHWDEGVSQGVRWDPSRT